MYKRAKRLAPQPTRNSGLPGTEPPPPNVAAAACRPSMQLLSPSKAIRVRFGNRFLGLLVYLAYGLAACARSDSGHLPSSLHVGGRAPRLAQVVVASPGAQPRIIDMWISEDSFRSGDMVSGIVITSSNVASVEVRIGGYAANIPRLTYGEFSYKQRVPDLPGFLKRDYTLTVTARNAAGAAVSENIPVHYL